MLPLRLHMENFGSFRAPAVADFHDVDYFVLVGPTGAGKSTVIDAICFALYGTVPRWGKENVVHLALAPSAASGRVALVFECGDRRYGVVRVLSRSARGTVTTKEARLDELDRSVDPASPMEDLLAAVVRPVAEGENVTVETQRITGLEYRFFTQCVVLPQGRFAEFLHAQPSKRQDLLVQLLDAEVYDHIRERARAEETTAKTAAQSTRDRLAALTDADEEAEQAATTALSALTGLSGQVTTGITRLRAATETAATARTATAEARKALAALDRLAMPPHVTTLAADLAEAADVAASRAATLEAADASLTEAEDALAALGDRTTLTLTLQAHADHHRLTTELTESTAALAQAAKETSAAADTAAEARRALADAESETRRLHDADLAAALRHTLVPGTPCPVCHHPYTAPAGPTAPAAPVLTKPARSGASGPPTAPAGPTASGGPGTASADGGAGEGLVPGAREETAVVDAAFADGGVAVAEDVRIAEELRRAERLVVMARGSVEAADTLSRAAERTQAMLDQRRASVEGRLGEVAVLVAAEPDLAAVEGRVAALDAAEEGVRVARAGAREARRVHGEAVRLVEELRGAESGALAELSAARDGVVPYGAPAVERGDLRAAWEALLGWRDAEAGRRRAACAELEAGLAAAVAARDAELGSLRELLAAHGVRAADDADAIARAVTVAVADARHRLERVRENRRLAAGLAEQVRERDEAAAVAHELTLRLRADNFEKWLTSEALDLLVTVASDTLRDLSGGQYELVLSDKSDIEVVDYGEAGMRRSVRTLSGGETFQASLALALALSDQVAGLSATAARSLDSIFLDEGFGTLDPATLDTVAATLERLSAGGDRMVGIVTHVPALAERVPVRFEITRDGNGSHLEKTTT